MAIDSICDPARMKSRLTSYWRLEAFNALLLPAVATVSIIRSGDGLSLWVVLTMVTTSLLLLVGAAAWRMELARVEGDAALAHRLLGRLVHTRRPAVFVTLLGAGAGLCEYAVDRAFTPSVIAAFVFGLLTLLEYINYYHVQLQHFDHLPDFKRLISGRGFRRAHLARAIERHQSRHRR